MTFGKIKENFMKYGISPDKMIYRFRETNSVKILANSIPKAGTNLLLKALYSNKLFHRKIMRTINNISYDQLMLRLKSIKSGQIAAAHLHYSKKVSDLLSILNIKHLLMIRDPRDIAVSNYIYITYKDKNHRLHNYFREYLNSDNERLTACIKGINGDALEDGKASEPLRYHIGSFYNWINDESCMVVKFEDLIGHKGGGNLKLQLQTLRNIYKYLGVWIPEHELQKIANNIFSPTSRTFHKGQIGSWRDHFTSYHIKVVKEELGDLLIFMGYENDYNWSK